jgi:alkanesulfonate monooxygenase SsuD/methylene tetrahydromethanopterin reductase-like flavin-dependent oxidoreductase (luciferase family)
MTVIEFGIILPQVAFSYDEVLDRARTCERLGFRSLWFFDHLYAPALPDVPALEGWTLATAVLAQTERLRVGHLVLCNNFRHPALLAKMITSLDVISDGRVDVGVGSGSYELEHTQAGLPWGRAAERSERLGESLAILTSMLSAERTTFVGRHYQVHDLPNLPLPVQRPRPPIFIGGSGERFTLPLVARHADAWNVPTYALGEIDRKVDALRVECERIERDPATVRRSLEAVLVIAPDDASLHDARRKAERRFGAPGFGLEEGGFVGTPPAICDRVADLVERGFTHFVFFTHDRGHEDTLALFAEEVMAKFAQRRD